MATRNNRLVPARAIHPGEVLREELQERGIIPAEFAPMVGMNEACLNEFLEGERDLDENLAMALEKALNIPYNVWMSLHDGYVCDVKAISSRKKVGLNAKSYSLYRGAQYELAQHHGV